MYNITTIDNIGYTLNKIRMYLFLIEESKYEAKLKYFVLLLDFLIRFKKYLRCERFQRFKYTIQAKLLQLYLFELNKSCEILIKDKISLGYKKIFNVSIDNIFNRIVEDGRYLSGNHRIFYDNLDISHKQNYFICFHDTAIDQYELHRFYRMV